MSNFKPYFVFAIYSLLLFSCKKSATSISLNENLTIISPVVAPDYSDYENGIQITTNVNDPLLKKINSYGYLISAGNSSFKKVQVGNNLLTTGVPIPSFYFTIDSLKASTNYTIRGYIAIDSQTEYAPDITFTTHLGSWKKLQDFNGNENLTATSKGPFGFAVNGSGYAMFVNGDLWQYNVQTDKWKQKNAFDLTQFTNNSEVPHIFFTIDNIAYLYLRGDIWKYDDNADSWSNILHIFGGATNPGSAFVINSKAYILQCSTDYYSNGGYSKVYDPVANTLKTINMNSTVDYATAFATASNIYIDSSHPYTYGYPVYIYNPQNDSFTHADNEVVVGAFAPRTYGVSFTINGVGYVGDGYNGTFEDSYYAYTENGASVEPQTRQTDYHPEFSSPNLGARSNGLSFVINDKAYVGFGDYARTDMWVFTP